MTADVATYRAHLDQLAPCFGAEESALLLEVSALFPSLPDAVARNLVRTTERACRQVPPLVRAIEASPIAFDGESLGERERNVQTLIDTLCSQGMWESLELRMPTSAVIGRALVITRLNFLKGLVYALEPASAAEAASLRSRLLERVDAAVLSKLAELLLTGVVSNPKNDPAIRQQAARHLIRIWTNLVLEPVAGFSTVLLSAWRARQRMRPTYGTLVGSHELISLLREECSPEFVRFFTRREVPDDELEAFREFMFGVSYEELKRLQDYMETQGVTSLARDEVARIVKQASSAAASELPGAEELLASYLRRRIRAQYRSVVSAPGPHKTAEGYLMQSLLREEIQRATP